VVNVVPAIQWSMGGKMPKWPWGREGRVNENPYTDLKFVSKIGRFIMVHRVARLPVVRITGKAILKRVTWCERGHPL
jgi:hypothetical protein